jgi:hypothetical protein
VLKCRDGAEHRECNEDLRHRQPPGEAAPGQQTGRQSLHDLANLQHAPAIVAVRGVAGGEHQDCGGNELNQPDHAEIERAAGHFVDLPADRDPGDLAGETRESADPKVKLERPVGEQGAGTGRQCGHARDHRPRDGGSST